MLTQAQALYNNRLMQIAEELDIPASKRQQAEDRYNAVGEWLDRDGSLLHPYKPRIHTQGSFRLGTVVRPIKAGKETDYDIDLVCQLAIAKDCDRDCHQQLQRKTAQEVKQLVGQRLRENGNYLKMLDEEGKRCWTLEYAEQDGIGFHIDILPSVPEENAFIQVLESNGVPTHYARSAIGITDKKIEKYNWCSSNPDGYGQWFDTRTALTPTISRLIAKKFLFESNRALYASIEKVPDIAVRTPLQQTIQILKRHRDTRFAGQKNENDKPISMVITTLAAILYQGEADVYSTLNSIVSKINMHAGLVDHSDFAVANAAFVDNQQIITRRWENGECKWYIGNPVNPLENFADRWHENDQAKAKAFFQWVAWIQADLISILGQRTIDDAVMSLSGPTALPFALHEAPKPIPTVKPVEYPRVSIARPNKPWSC
jgi:hypothetical protein